VVNKFVGFGSLPRYRRIFDIPNPRAWEHISYRTSDVAH
jgi:hypothetical protein